MSSSSLEHQGKEPSENLTFYMESAPHRSKKKSNRTSDKHANTITLLSIPNEILFQIIDEVCPDGIESFALCCKTIYGLAQNTIKLHNSCKQEFSRGCLHWANHLHLPPDFGVAKIVRYARAAPYVKGLLITRRTYFEDSGSSLNPAQIIGLDGLTTRDREWRQFFDASRCHYIPDCDVDLWQEMLESADEAFVTSMLLAQLPNLQRASFRGVYNSVPIVQMVGSISASPNLGIGALSKLTHAEIHNHNRDYDPVGLYESFALLPSMRHLNIESFGRGTFSHGPATSSVSNLRHIEMRFGAFEMQAFVDLLSRAQSLESFSYYYFRADFSPHQLATLVRLLEKYACYSMQHLSLTANEWLDKKLTEKDEIYVESFHGFERLESIEINIEMIIRCVNGKWVAPRLVDMLPRSLKELRFADIAYATKINEKIWSMTRIVEGMFTGLRAEGGAFAKPTNHHFQRSRRDKMAA